MIPKKEAKQIMEINGAGFVANVIDCHYKNPALKLRKLAALILAGVQLASGNTIDQISVDGKIMSIEEAVAL